MDFLKLKESFAKKVYPIYLLQGDDEFCLQKAITLFKNNFLQNATLNFTYFQAEEVKEDNYAKIVVALQSLPFLEERRIIVVENLQPTKKEFDKYFKYYFQNPAITSIFVIVNREKKRDTIDWTREKNLQIVHCNKLDEVDLLKWIARVCKQYNVQIEEGAAKLLINYTLQNMSRIEMELQKLAAYVENEEIITEEMIIEFVYPDTAYKIYELSNALMQKNYESFLKIQGQLLQKGFDAMAILNILAKQYQTLFEISTLHKKTDKEIADILACNPYAVKMSKKQIAQQGEVKILTVYKLLIRAINDCKNGYLTPNNALLQTTAKIFYA